MSRGAFQRNTVYAPVAEAAMGRYIEESVKVGLGAWRGPSMVYSMSRPPMRNPSPRWLYER